MTRPPWVTKLGLVDRALPEVTSQALPEALTHPHETPKWVGNVLQIKVAFTKGLQQQIGRIYPAAEWVVDDYADEINLVFNLHGGDAAHYAKVYNFWHDRQIALTPQSAAVQR